MKTMMNIIKNTETLKKKFQKNRKMNTKQSTL